MSPQVVGQLFPRRTCLVSVGKAKTLLKIRGRVFLKRGMAPREQGLIWLCSWSTKSLVVYRMVLCIANSIFIC